MTRNRGCLEVVFWLFLGFLLLAGLKHLIS